MPTAQLSHRSILRIDGPDAEHFLQNILTTDLDSLAQREIKPGALLTPQGKILFDFLISRDRHDGFVIECNDDLMDDFVRRLTLYKLRAKVGISKQEQAVVIVSWHDESGSSQTDSTGINWLADTRFPAAAGVRRAYGTATETDAASEDWHSLRIGHGIAEGGADFKYSDVFPHDVLLDLNGGVGFRKGCYVGQEVVSRMQHRGTARRRVMIVEGEAALPGPGTDILANDRAIGTLGSAHGNRGLAIMRIDRVKDALDAGHPILAGGVAIALTIPDWASYTLPQDSAGDA